MGAFMKAVMKSMKKSKSGVARGRGAKARVYGGSKNKTSGGLTKSDLKKNKLGRVVSKAKSESAKKNWAKSPLKAWSEAVKAARKALNLKGFVAIKERQLRAK